MRWEQLFADLEAQAVAEEARAADAESGSRARAEHGRLRLVDRLHGAVGAEVLLTCRGAGQVGGRLLEVGPDWLLLQDAQQRELLVGTGAVRAVGGLTAVTVPAPEGAVARRLDLRRALRGLVRDRAAVQVLLDDGTAVTGTIDRVGADFVEVAEHPADRPRRAAAVTGVRAVVVDAVAVVRRLPPPVS
ncbi:hypothetical protein [Modestobacter sp. NPDC049651]|uniref:hypothetical protein n=1 Tax=unclassified Modestobacter TaxID=2643866 RepID=UPI003407D942